MPVALILQTSWEVLVDRTRSMMDSSSQAFVDLLLALIVVLVGWLIALLIAKVVLMFLRAVRFNNGVRGLLGEGPPLRHEPAWIAARVAQGVIVLLAVMLAADILGFQLTQSVGDRLRDVLPRVVASCIVFVVGISIAMLIGSVVGRVFASAGMKAARIRGQIVTVVLTGFAVLLSLEQLGLAAQFIIALGLTAVGAVGLALALAFGLGCRELARDFVVEYLRSIDEDRSPRGS